MRPLKHLKGKTMGKYNGDDHEQHENDNHSNQLNDNNDAYWSSRDMERDE